MNGPVRCPRCGAVSQGGVLLPPGAEAVSMESPGPSSEPYQCPLCKAIIPSTAQQESENLVAPLLEIAELNRDAVRELKDISESLLKSKANYQQVEEAYSHLPNAIRKLVRHIPSERTSAFLALLVATAAFVLQVTDRRKDPQTNDAGPWRPRPSLEREELFDDLSRGLDLAKKWTLKWEEGFDQGSRQIYVEDGKLHFCAHMPNITAFLVPKLPRHRGKTIIDVSMKMALLSSEVEPESFGSAGISISGEAGRLHKFWMGRWFKEPMIGYSINDPRHGQPWHGPWPSSWGYILEEGHEYIVEAVEHFRTVDFNVVGHSYARGPADSGSLASFRLGFFGSVFRDRVRPPHKNYVHVTVDDVRITYA
jgi:hypothetical protein